MLDQIKIGQFISDLRKEKGLTQKELAERLQVSDKTISKWETGRGIPDTSIMNELCINLNININELLSGEKISGDTYCGKAEKNMVDLLKNKENKKENILWTVIGNSISIVLFIMFLFFAIFMGTGLSGVIRFIDIPSIMIILVFLCISLGIGGQLKYFFKGFSILYRRKELYYKELLYKMEYAMNVSIIITILAGILGSVIGIIQVLSTVNMLEQIAPNLAVSILTIFYALIFILIIYSVKIKIHGIIREIES